MRSKRFILAALLLLIAGAVGFAVFSDKEPSYKGRSLSEWIIRHQESTSSRQERADALEREQECRKAICAIGSNAVPFLLEWIQYEEPSWRGALRDLRELVSSTPFKPRPFGYNDRLRWGAVRAFGFIGSQGASAIPELNRLIYLNSSAPGPQAAAAALISLGEVSDPAVAAAFTTTNEYARRRAAGAAFESGPRAERFAPLLVNALDDTDFTVALNAANSLGHLDVDIAPALTRLTNCFTRPEREFIALTQLGVLGRKATPVLPAITNLLTHTNRLVRWSATNALFQITR
jgi:HEAT repeat protein